MPAIRIIDIKRTETGAEPITLQQTKDHLILNSSADDALLTRMEIQCRKAIEEYCAISIITKDIVLFADFGKAWELPYGPVIGLKGVETRIGNEGSGPATYQTAESGWSQEGEHFLTFNPAENIIGEFYGPNNPNYYGYDYPRRISPRMVRYKLTYQAGYEIVPEDLKLAILNEIAYRYEQRGEAREIRADVSEGICDSARVLANPHKRELWF